MSSVLSSYTITVLQLRLIDCSFVFRYAHPLKIALPGQVERYSPLREAVYAEGATELVGPAEDPDGWELASGSAKGRLFDQEDVEVFLRVSPLFNPHHHDSIFAHELKDAIVVPRHTPIVPPRRVHPVHTDIREFEPTSARPPLLPEIIRALPRRQARIRHGRLARHREGRERITGRDRQSVVLGAVEQGPE